MERSIFLVPNLFFFSLNETRKIETKIEHPILIPDQKAFRKFSKNTNLPNARRLSKLILSLPIHEYLSFKNLDYVIKNINKFYNANHKRLSNY